jgi:hypothetical protein
MDRFFLKEGKETDMLKYALPDNPVIQKAHECFRQFTADDELRALAEAREKAVKKVGPRVPARGPFHLPNG